MKFSKYQRFVVAILAFLQFTVVLDFAILSPLGALLLQELRISTVQFGLVVSVYAFAAGISGFLAAGFADKFDRKKILLFFYAGFIVGTLLCGIATGYRSLLVARTVTGLFGGVLGSISSAIVADLFPFEMRGRVMGFVQMALAAAQVLGIPLGLYLSNRYGWHSPFLMIVVTSIPIWVVMLLRLKPIDDHIVLQKVEPSEDTPLKHVTRTFSKSHYLWAFGSTMLLTTGGFMLMPFASAFSVHNLGISLKQLPLVYAVTGVASIITGPIIGKLSDGAEKYAVFVVGSILTMPLVAWYCNLGITPLWQVIALNVVLFTTVLLRMISAQTLLSAVPEINDRGAFMSVNASLQQLAGGVASSVAGLVVVQTPDGKLTGYEGLGFAVTFIVTLTIVSMYKVNAQLASNGVLASARPLRA
ncbi:MFS transporter [Pendulispora brunnea]|uniref:MFS transporter n=1 Tax=Pendulispora brunnea TaxID=2905690 RepID=A0ABZ2JW57_9BACT